MVPYMEAYKKILNHIETEVIDLSYSISFKAEQENVYSPRIADLILRSGSLLESIIKEKYGKTNVKYDEDYVIKKLGLGNKIVIVTFLDYKFPKKIFTPFKKNQERLNKTFTNKHAKGSEQYSWNNAYQSLRHQFLQMIPEYGNLKYLFEILSAIAVLLPEGSILFSNVEQNKDGTYIGWNHNTSNGFAIRKSFNTNGEIK